MSFKDELDRSQTGGEEHDALALDPALKAALANFRLSVHAWSEAEYNRPRMAAPVAPRLKLWRMAAGCALGCALIAGGVSGGVYERHLKQARVAAALEAEHQRQLAADREAEELMADVDSDISRQVPSAMEPLAQLMAEDESK
jgi:hypothetical protein